MSDKLTRNQQLSLINTFCCCHDLLCKCYNPAYHCLKELATQLGKELSPEQKKEIQKCLGITTAEDGAAADDPGFDTGDLEALFAEDGKDEDLG